MFVTVEHPQHGRRHALLVDVSRTGLRCKSDHFFPCGGVVTLHAPEGSSLTPCQARIVRQSVLEDDEEPGFEYGFRFVDQESDARHAWFLALRQRYSA
jgi:hypothetical protein